MAKDLITRIKRLITKKESEFMNNKTQTFALIGVALFIVGAILLYVSLSSPKVYDDNENQLSATEQEHYSVKSNDTADDSAFPVNINTATVQDLQLVEGIGESRAKNIVAYRESIGGFSSVEELKNIDGIGDKLYEKISPYLTV